MSVLRGLIQAARSRWLDARDRLLADPGFQRWCARFPLTRPIARRRARALFDLSAGFVYSQVLHACVRLHVFETLRAGPLAIHELAPALGLDAAAARLLCGAAASLDLLTPRGADRFGLGPHGAALLGQPGVRAMIAHHAVFYDDLRDPAALLRGDREVTGLARFWAYSRAVQPAALRAARIAAYSELMASSQSLIAEQVLEACPLARRRCLLDVGGGEGAFAAAAAARWPDLRVIVFDLPAVAERARVRLSAAGLDARARVVGGDFLRDTLPSGADACSLVRVLHDHDDRAALTILRAARAALQPGGLLLVAEPMAGTRGAEPVAGAYFALYLLAMGRGRPRAAGELVLLMRAAGFERVRRRITRLPLQVSVLTASVAPATNGAAV